MSKHHVTNKSLLFDLSTLSGCYYAPSGHHYGVGRVAYGFAQQLSHHFPEQLGLSSGMFSAECRPFLDREFPHLAPFCIEPATTALEHKLMNWVDLGAPAGGMRDDVYSKMRRAAWRVYDNKLRWQRDQATRKHYHVAGLLHCEFDMSVVARCPRARKVHTIHDLIGVTGVDVPRDVRTFKTKKLVSAWRNGTHFVCDSKYTADCLIELIGAGSARIGWTGLGLDPVFKPVNDPIALGHWRARLSIGASQQYVVAHTGQIERKNLVSIIEVVARLRQQVDRDLILLFVGYPKQLAAEFDQRVSPSIRWREFVRFSGNLKDDEFPVIYSGAALMLFLSWAEGFGLPALEAMGCGVPLLCSNLTSLPEVVGQGGILVDPADLDAVTAAAAEVLQTPTLQESLRASGLQQATSCSWEAAGQRLKDIWNSALNA